MSTITVENLIKTLSSLPPQATVIIDPDFEDRKPEGESPVFLIDKIGVASINEENELEPCKEEYLKVTGEEFPESSQEIVIIGVSELTNFIGNLEEQIEQPAIYKVKKEEEAQE